MSDYRLEELSALSGVSVRNIRAYRERGLLDPPRRQGRSAYYDERHLSQLRIVNELLRKGFTTAHIAEFFSSTRQGLDLADRLGLAQTIFAEPRESVPVAVDAVAVDIDPEGDEARRLLQHGLAEVADGRVTMINPDVAEIVGRATDQLPYVRAVLRVADRVDVLLDDLAATVVESLQESLAAGADSVPGRQAELHRLADDYGVLGHRVVADQFGAALRLRLLTAVFGDSAGSRD